MSDITPTEIESVLKQLAVTPRLLATLSRGQGRARLHTTPEEDAWSPNEILGHLRVCADVWGKTMLVMMTQDYPTLRYVSPRSRLKKTNYLELDFDVSLKAFTEQRRELLKALKALATKEWLRGATFTATTRGREQTIFSYAQRMANHEREHCKQIKSLLK